MVRATRSFRTGIHALAALLAILAAPCLLATAGGASAAVQAPAASATALPDDADEPAAPVDSPANEATVRFYNRDIVTLRGEFLGRDPELRARTSEATIRRVVERGTPAKVEFKESSEGTLVILGGELAMILTPADLDVLNGETMAQARAGVARRLGDAVTTAQREQAPARLLRGMLCGRCSAPASRLRPQRAYCGWDVGCASAPSAGSSAPRLPPPRARCGTC